MTDSERAALIERVAKKMKWEKQPYTDAYKNHRNGRQVWKDGSLTAAGTVAAEEWLLERGWQISKHNGRYFVDHDELNEAYCSPGRANALLLAIDGSGE